MKIEGSRLKRVCDLLNLVSIAPGIPGSVFINFELQENKMRLKLSSNVSVVGTIAGVSSKEDKEVVTRGVDRRTLFPFISEGGDYDFIFKGDQLFVKNGKRHAEIRTVAIDWPYGDWSPKMKDIQSIKLEGEVLEAIQCARLCASDDTVSQELNCVRVEFGKRAFVFASNDLVMCCGAPEGVGDNTIAMPLSLVDVLSKENISKILVGKKIVGALVDGVLIFGQAPEKARLEFPVDRLKKLIIEGRKSKVVFTTSTRELVRVCESFATYLTNVPSMEWELRLDVEKGTSVRAEAFSPYARFEDTLIAKVQGEAKLDIHLAMLAPIISFLNGKTKTVQVAASSTIVYMRSGVYEFMISQRAKK